MPLPDNFTDRYSKNNSRIVFELFQNFEPIFAEEYEYPETVMQEFFEPLKEISEREDKNKIMGEFIARLILKNLDSYAEAIQNVLVKKFSFRDDELDKEIGDFSDRSDSESNSESPSQSPQQARAKKFTHKKSDLSRGSSSLVSE